MLWPCHQALHTAAAAAPCLPPAALPAARIRLQQGLRCGANYRCCCCLSLAGPLLLLLRLPLRPLLRGCGRVAPAAVTIHTQHQCSKRRVARLKLCPRVDATRHICRTLKRVGDAPESRRALHEQQQQRRQTEENTNPLAKPSQEAQQLNLPHNGIKLGPNRNHSIAATREAAEGRSSLPSRTVASNQAAGSKHMSSQGRDDAHLDSPSRTVASNQAWLPSAQYSLELAIM